MSSTQTIEFKEGEQLSAEETTAILNTLSRADVLSEDGSLTDCRLDLSGGESVPLSLPPPVSQSVNQCSVTATISSAMIRKLSGGLRRERRSPPYNTTMNDVSLLYDAAVKCFVLPRVRRDGMMLRHCDVKLRNDPEVVLAACEENGEALQHAGDLALDNEELLCKIMSLWGLAIQYVSERCRGLRSVVIAACSDYGMALRFASGDLLADRAIVLHACAENTYGSALQFAPLELRNDKAFVGELVRMDWSHLEFASAELQDDFDFIADAIEASRGDAICFASPRLKTDRCIALLATNASQQRSGRLHASALAAQQTMEGGGPLF